MMADYEKTVNRLLDLRRIATATPTETELATAVHSLQLDTLGFVSDDPAALDKVLSQPLCGCAESVMQGGLALWPASIWKAGPIRIWLAPNLPRLSAANWKAVCRAALDSVEAICGLRFAIVADRQEAHAVITAANIDGQSGVLADQELPTGIETRRQLVMRLDVAEAWDSSLTARTTMALATLKHEGGHRDGLEHIPASYGRAVMNPILQGLDDWTELDRRQYVSRYPITVPTPAPAPADPAGPFAPFPPSAAKTYTITVNGELSVAGHRLVKVG